MKALWLLIGLQLRGWLRYAGRGLGTLKGAVLAFVGIAVFVPWFFSIWFRAGEQGLDPGQMRLYGPPALAVYCLLNLFFTAGERALYFTPPEVNLLFPGPFSRRQLLAFKLASTALVGLPTSLVMAAVLRPHAGSALSAFVGLWLILLFMQLFAVAVQFVVSAVGAHFFQMGKTIALAVLVLGLAAGAVVAHWAVEPGAGLRLLARIPESPIWQFVLRPFGWFIECFLAQRPWPELATYATLSLLVNLALLDVVFNLDSLNIESVAVSSARRYSRLQRLRGRLPMGDSDAPTGAHRSLAMLPWWGGIGPLLWRQLMAAARNPASLVLGSLPFIFLLAGPMLASEDDKEGGAAQVAPFLIGGVLWVTLFLTTLFPFDFRGDLDRMAILKTLPLSAWRVAVGQLLGPVIVVCCFQSIVLVGLHFLLDAQGEGVAACFLLPFNFLLFAVENLLFLMFPMRLVGANPGDFQTIGKNVLFLMARTTGIGLALSAAAAAGVAAYFVAGGSQVVGLFVGWLVLASAGACLVPLIALAFAAFDVSRDVPA